MSTVDGRARWVRTPWGGAHAAIEPTGLRLRATGGLDGEQVVGVLLLAALALGVGGALLPEPYGWLLWAPALVALVVAVGMVVAIYAAVAVGLLVLLGSLVTPSGRRRLSADLDSGRRRLRTAREGRLLPVADLLAPPLVEPGPVRATLVLPLRDGPVRISTWAWRVGALERLAAGLDALARAR